MDRVAGSRRRFLIRSSGLIAGIAVGGCASPRASLPHTRDWLEPVYGLSGATLTNRVGPTGHPLPGGQETFLPFLFPVAVVSSFGALFIADAGYGRLFRYDHVGSMMAAVPGVRVTREMRLIAGANGTIHLMDRLGGEITRYSMHSGLLPAMHPRLPTSRYLDFAVDPVTGRVFAVDSLHNLVDRIEPVGRVALAHLEFITPGPIAVEGDRLYVADSQCGCVNEWRNGVLVRALAKGKLRLPQELASERGELYLLDGFDRTLSRVFEGGIEVQTPQDLGLTSPQQFSVSDGMMYVADGPGRRIAVFRIKRR